MKQIETFLNVSAYFNSIEEHKHVIQNVSKAGGIKDEKFFYDRIAFTVETNPALFAIATTNGWNYTSQSAVTISELAKLNWYEIACAISGNTDLTHFNEFQYCTGVVSILRGMFSGCTSIQEITIPKNVISIENGAFDPFPANVKIKYACSAEDIDYSDNGWSIIVEYSGLTTSSNLFKSDLYDHITGAVYVSGGNNDTYIRVDELTPVVNDQIDLTGDNHIYIKYCLDGDTIPAMSFESCNCIIGVYISKQIRKIDDCGFRFCNKISSIEFPDELTYLGEECFYSCSGIRSLNLPSELTYLGSNCFGSCSSLAGTMTIPEKVKNLQNSLFNGCTSLNGLILPESLTSVGNYCFRQCTSLLFIECKSLIAPTLGNDVFGASYSSQAIARYGVLYHPAGTDYSSWMGTASLTGRLSYFYWIDAGKEYVPAGDDDKLVVTYNVTSTSEPTKIFSDATNFSSAKLPNGDNIPLESGYTFSEIGEQTIIYTIKEKTAALRRSFSGCNITNVSIPNMIEKINDSAFKDNSTLTSVTLPNSIVRIGASAFSNTNLTTINIPDSVLMIDSGCFSYCANLLDVVIGSGLTTLPVYAFYSDNNLTGVTVPDTVTEILDSCFGRTAFISGNTGTCPIYGNIFYPNNKVAYMSISGEGILEYTIKDGTVSISPRCFSYNRYATSVSVPSSLVKIGNECFYSATSLERIIYPSRTQKVEYGDSCFQYCNSVKKTTDVLTDTIEVLPRSIFWYCHNMTNIFIPNTVKKALDRPFVYCESVTSITFEDGAQLDGIGITFIQGDGNTTVDSIVIPDSMTYIGSEAFENVNFGHFVLGKNVTSMTTGTSSFTTGTIPSLFRSKIVRKNFVNKSTLKEDDGSNLYWGATLIDDYADGFFISGTTAILYGNSESRLSVTIPSGITQISRNCFRSGDSITLTSITIPSSVTLSSNCFEGMTSLKQVIFQDGFTSIPSACFSDCTGLTSVTIPNSVTSIGEKAFYNTNITSINIPSGVTSLANSAFSECTSLVNVTISTPNALTEIGKFCFYNCHSLSSFTIPNGITSIGYQAFRYCSALTSITIPDSVTSIDSYAFYGCTGATSITLSNNLEIISNYSFYGCSGITHITIPSSVTRINESAFNYCSALSGVTFEGNSDTMTISPSAFNNTPYLNTYCETYGSFKYLMGNIAYVVTSTTIQDSDISFKAGTKIIGDSCFYGCRNLTNIVIPSGVEKIGDMAFGDCANLTSLTIPDTVTEVGIRLFSYRGSPNITNISIPDSITKLDYRTFDGTPYIESGYCPTYGNIYYPNNVVAFRAVSKGITSCEFKPGTKSITSSCFSGCTALTGSINIPNQVIHIGNSAFTSCSSITSISVPTGVTKLGEYVMAYCTSLTSATLHDNITEIGQYCFRGSGLKDFTVPRNVVNLPYYCFDGCSGLTSVTLYNNLQTISSYCFSRTGILNINIPDTVTSIGSYAFSSCSTLTNVTLGTGLTSISEYCFANDSGLTTINLQNTKIEIIPERCFYQCRSLTGITFPETLTELKIDCFSGSGLRDNLNIPSSVRKLWRSCFYNCSGITSITIQEGIEELNLEAFDGIKLTELIIPNSVKSLITNAYVNIGKNTLKKLVFGDGIKTIPASGFSAYTALEEITMGKGISRVNVSAFANASSLRSIKCYSVISPTVYSNTFYGCKSGGTLYYPVGSTTSYSGWLSTNYYFLGYYKWSGATFDPGYDRTVITVVYDITATTKQDLMSGSLLTSIEKMEIDGIGEITPVTGYSFPTTGQKTVYYTLLTPSIPDSAFIRNKNIVSINLNNILNIGTYAFSGCSKLSGVVFPEVIKIIRDGSFMGSKITNLSIPDSVTKIGASAFTRCYSLTSVTFGNKLSGLQGYEFYACTGLTDITIPSTMRKIGQRSFSSCINLTGLTFLGNTIELDPECFSSCGFSSLTLPDTVNGGISAFTYCSALTSITLGINQSEIPTCMFRMCTSLREVVMPNVSRIGVCAFQQCTSLTSIVLPNDLETLEYYSFYLCDSLTSITFNNGLTRINSGACAGCTSLSSVVLPETVTFLDDRSFSGCTSLTSVTLSDNITTFGSEVFRSCSSLTAITMPNKLTAITPDMLSGNTNLRTITIGNGTKLIYAGSFSGCTALTSITFNSELQELGEKILDGCSSLERITCNAPFAPVIQANTFANVGSNGTLYYPSGSNYAKWLGTGSDYLGYYGWTGQEMS